MVHRKKFSVSLLLFLSVRVMMEQVRSELLSALHWVINLKQFTDRLLPEGELHRKFLSNVLNWVRPLRVVARWEFIREILRTTRNCLDNTVIQFFTGHWRQTAEGKLSDTKVISLSCDKKKNYAATYQQWFQFNHLWLRLCWLVCPYFLWFLNIKFFICWHFAFGDLFAR